MGQRTFSLRRSLVFLCLAASLPLAARAEDLGFRFNGTACVDKTGKAGLNPSVYGQCGDLRHVTISPQNFANTDFSGAVFDGSSFQSSSFSGATLTSASFVGTDLTGAVLTSAVIHATNFSQAILLNTHLAGADIKGANFSGANFSGVSFSTMTLANNSFKGTNLSGAALDSTDLSGCDFTAANLRSSNLQSAKLVGATLDQANFSGADLTSANLTSATGSLTIFTGALLRQANLGGAKLLGAVMGGAQMNQASFTGGDFRNANMRHAVLTGAVLDKANLNGVLINRATTLPITLDAALALGMVMDASINLLVIFDSNDPVLGNFLGGLEALGIQSTVSTTSDMAFDGSMELSLYSAILLLNAQDNADMPPAGQNALLTYAQTGGIFISTGTAAYNIAGGYYHQMTDLILLTYQSFQSATEVLTPATNVTSPVLYNITGNLTTTNVPISVSTLTAFATNPAVLLMSDQSGNPMVVERDLGTGHVVSLSFCAPQDSTCLSDPTVQQLVANATRWATPSAP